MSRQVAQNLFVTGGCKSGKSAFAQSWVENRGTPRLYIATAEIFDTEMADRVRNHQESRGKDWDTVEAPLDVAEALREHAPNYAAVLLDCATIWMANMQFHGYEMPRIKEHIHALAEAIDNAPCPVAVVASEIGWGIVPDNALGRAFRDLAGTCNQILAAHMPNVVMVVSGLPLVLKGQVHLPQQPTKAE